MLITSQTYFYKGVSECPEVVYRRYLRVLNKQLSRRLNLGLDTGILRPLILPRMNLINVNKDKISTYNSIAFRAPLIVNANPLLRVSFIKSRRFMLDLQFTFRRFGSLSSKTIARGQLLRGGFDNTNKLLSFTCIPTNLITFSRFSGRLP